MCWSEVGTVPAEHLDPLPAGVVEGLRDEVGGVAVTPSGHGDVRRCCAGVFTDEDVGAVNGVALRAVDGGGVGELDEPCGSRPAERGR